MVVQNLLPLEITLVEKISDDAEFVKPGGSVHFSNINLDKARTFGVTVSYFD